MDKFTTGWPSRYWYLLRIDLWKLHFSENELCGDCDVHYKNLRESATNVDNWPRHIGNSSRWQTKSEYGLIWWSTIINCGLNMIRSVLLSLMSFVANSDWVWVWKGNRFAKAFTHLAKSLAIIGMHLLVEVWGGRKRLEAWLNAYNYAIPEGVRRAAKGLVKVAFQREWARWKVLNSLQKSEEKHGGPQRQQLPKAEWYTFTLSNAKANMIWYENWAPMLWIWYDAF
jgi:hypothetical protein